MFSSITPKQNLFASNENLFRPKTTTTKKSASKSSREAITGYTCSLYQDYLYLFGGWHQIAGEASDSVQIYSLLDNQWLQPQVQVATSALARFGHTASVYKNMIIYYGGKEDPRGLRCLQFTNILVIDPENPTRLAWLPWNQRENGPPDCICHFSHIYDDKMFVFQQNNPRSLSYFDLDTKTWSNNLLQDTTDTSNRLWIFSGSKLFGFHRDPESKESQYLQMIDLDSPAKWRHIRSSGDSVPCLLPTNIYSELNGRIYILGSELKDEDIKGEVACRLWSYDTRGDIWKALEDSGSLVQLSDTQRTLTYKNKILTISVDLQEPSLEILHADLNEEDMASQPTKNQKEICREKPESFIKDVKSLFAGMLFTDVVFEVEDQQIPAHRSILAYRSQYFMNLFTEDQKSDIIKVSDIKPHLFKAILQYIYSNGIELDEQLALELLPILDKYLLENLRGLCERYLAAQIRKDNVISLLMTADSYKIQKLKEACFRFIVKNLQNVCDSDEVMELSKPLFLELLKFQNPSPNQVQEKKIEPKVDLTLDEIIEPKKKSRGRPKKY